jgi:hypothetical protein
MQKVRAIILKADTRMTECIKWSSPTFMYQGNLASFNPSAKRHVSLMFHTGAKIPGKHPCLEGGGDTARYMTFADVADVGSKKAALEAVVESWCAMKDGATAEPGKKNTAKKKTAAKKTAAKKTAAKTTVAKKATRKSVAKSESV